MTEIILNDGASAFAPELTRSDSNFQVNPTPAAAKSGVITQGRTASGSPVVGAALNGNHIVNIGGLETSLKAAVAARLVTANADGTFSVVSPEARAQAQREREAPAKADAAAAFETVDRETEATLTTITNGVSPSTVMGAILDFANGKEVRQDHITHAASELRMEPGQVRAMVDQVRGAFEAQARATVDRAGLPADEVFAWAYQNKPEMMKQAIRQQATERSTKGYQRVAQAYLENLDTINPQALMNAELGEGLEIRKASNGKLVLRTPKGEFEYRAAVRAGLLKFGRAGGRR